MKRELKKLLSVILLFFVTLTFSGCSDDDCGDCTTELITPDINLDGATLRMYNGIPTIYVQTYLNEYTEEAYCFICNEKKAKDLINKVKNGGMINVNVKGKMRELREGEPDLANYNYQTKTRTTSCDIEIIKIKKR
ncbi:MAG: hypothetical protein IJ681_04035 [Bacteroidales bacterium]|nr:hypothetical protein [Bacteroidales bacterium]